MEYYLSIVDLLLMISSLFNAGLFVLAFLIVLIKINGKVFMGLGAVLWIYVIFFITRGVTDSFLYLASKGDYTSNDELFT